MIYRWIQAYYGVSALFRGVTHVLSLKSVTKWLGLAITLTLERYFVGKPTFYRSNQWRGALFRGATHVLSLKSVAYSVISWGNPRFIAEIRGVMARVSDNPNPRALFRGETHVLSLKSVARSVISWGNPRFIAQIRGVMARVSDNPNPKRYFVG
jgi:hypothetical protein